MTTIRGKDYYFGPYDAPESRTKYNRLLAEYLSADRSPVFGVRREDISIAECLVAYLTFAKEYYKESTEYENLHLASKPLMELYADSLAQDFGPVQFKAVRTWWINRGCSRQYVNKQMKRMMRIIKWLVQEGKMDANIHHALKCIDPLRKGRSDAPETAAITPVDDAVVDATIPHMTDVVAAMVRFQRLTGARPGEVCSLKPCMVQKSSSEVWEIQLEQHKTAWRGKPRTIYVGPQAQKVLAPYLKRDPNSYCFSAAESVLQQRQLKHQRRVTPLSCGNKPGSQVVRKPEKKAGDKYTTQSYGRAIKYACLKAFPAPAKMKGAALKKWNSDHAWAPNQLRHALATSIRKSDGLEAAAVLLGHSEVGVTQVYAEADRSKAIDIARRMG
jgi:integrase